jgi:hypothetical protein
LGIGIFCAQMQGGSMLSRHSKSVATRMLYGTVTDSFALTCLPSEIDSSLAV